MRNLDHSQRPPNPFPTGEGTEQKDASKNQSQRGNHRTYLFLSALGTNKLRWGEGLGKRTRSGAARACSALVNSLADAGGAGVRFASKTQRESPGIFNH